MCCRVLAFYASGFLLIVFLRLLYQNVLALFLEWMYVKPVNWLVFYITMCLLCTDDYCHLFMYYVCFHVMARPQVKQPVADEVSSKNVFNNNDDSNDIMIMIITILLLMIMMIMIILQLIIIMIMVMIMMMIMIIKVIMIMMKQLTVAQWCHMESWVCHKIDSGIGLLPDGTKPLPELMWAYCQLDI